MPGIRYSDAWKHRVQTNWTRFGEAGSGRGQEHCRYAARVHSRGDVRWNLRYFLLLLNNDTSKRIETQLKDTEAKSEKKKAEVCRHFYVSQRVVHRSLHRLSKYKQRSSSRANPLRNYLVDKSNSTAPITIMRVMQRLEIHWQGTNVWLPLLCVLAFSRAPSQDYWRLSPAWNVFSQRPAGSCE